MAQGNVETWLGALLNEALSSLHAVIKRAHITIEDPNFNLVDFCNTFPAQVSFRNPVNCFYCMVHHQVGIVGIQLLWTRDAEIALTNAPSDKKIMASTDDDFLTMLNTLIEVTTRDLTRIERTKYETLITIHLHQRDIFHDMVSQK